MRRPGGPNWILLLLASGLAGSVLALRTFAEPLPPLPSETPSAIRPASLSFSLIDPPDKLPGVAAKDLPPPPDYSVPPAPGAPTGGPMKTPPPPERRVSLSLEKATVAPVREPQSSSFRIVDPIQPAAAFIQVPPTPEGPPAALPLISPSPVTAPLATPLATSLASPLSSGCPGCGRSPGLGPRREGGYGGCSHCGGGWNCAPGRHPCHPCEANTALGRFFCDFYECLCCQDPCYEPLWLPPANAALFVDTARPTTQQEIRWNSMRGGIFPDRSEYIWARADGRGKGPRPPAGRLGEVHFAIDELVLITETAMGKLGTIFEMPYRTLDPEFYPHRAGFGDLALGTKTLLLDCELLLVTFQFKTYIPIGQSFKGLGTGHVSLEPSLIFALKLSEDTYLQGQLSEWIPLGGDPEYAGSVLHSHFSLNHVLCRIVPDVPLIGTLELQSWSFQDGHYTDPVLGPYQKSSDDCYASLGPGLRLFFCDKIDIGFGAAYAVSGDHFAREFYRVSFRARF